ncbi:transcriptional regulator, partial [Butyricicoccus sp. 1XD8-22]
GQMLNSVRKRPKQLMRSHLKLALNSFDELTEAYNELEIKYRELQSEHDKLIKWLNQGVNFLEHQK